MTGRRLPNNIPTTVFRPGDYSQVDGEWWGMTPTGTVVPLRGVKVERDLQITAASRGGWYLKRGAWKQVGE